MAHDLSVRLVEAVVANLPSPSPRLPLLVALYGPTASGKSALAIHLAEHVSGEIVSCDSVAVFRDMEIGTAKPSAEERARVPHHMLDIVSPDETYTAGDYSRDARAVLAGIAVRGHMPIVAGGTGLYFRALLEGLFPGPRRMEPLRERLRELETKRGSGYLACILRRIDPVSAARIHPNDVPKIIRAIEVTFAAGQPISEAWRAGRDRLDGYRILKLGLDPPKSDLQARIDRRADFMLSHGLMEETAGLLAKFGPDRPPLASLGYKQAVLVLQGKLTMEDAIAATRQGHRQYAKRQMTWFRRESDIHWLHGFGDDPAIAAQALACVGKALQSSI